MHTALQQFDGKVAQGGTFYLQLVTGSSESEIITGAPAELSSVFHRATEREYENAAVWRNVSGKLGYRSVNLLLIKSNYLLFQKLSVGTEKIT